MKVWRAEEARRLGIGEIAVAMRITRGKYLGLKVRRVNARVVFVQI
jgi:hypothetical protein